MKIIWWKILYKIFDFIRKHTWKDYDKNEKFYCGHCGKPVFNRILFCSLKCSDAAGWNYFSVPWKK